jgi:Common central domain of tyrosinase
VSRRLVLLFIAVIVTVAVCVAPTPTPTEAAGTCPTTLRHDARDLTPQQWSAFVAAVQAMQQRPNATTPSTFDRLTKLHTTMSGSVHGTALFFAWHRRFLKDFENKLRAIDPTVSLPYWNWTQDSSAPEQSYIWGVRYLGGNGGGPDNVVQTGPFAGWHPLNPQPHGLKRQWSNGARIAPWASSESINSAIAGSGSYDALRRAIEPVPHGTVHVNVGGDMSLLNGSPNDPLFWLFHAYIDKIWADWQNAHPSLALTSYGGPNAEGSAGRLSDTLPGFGTDTVRSIMDTRSSGLCYAYAERSAGNAPALPRATSAAPVPVPIAAAAPTTTTVTSSQNPAAPGQRVAITATISDAEPGSTVRFRSRGRVLPGCRRRPVLAHVTAWTATCRTRAPRRGLGSVSARFSGGGSYAPSTGRLRMDRASAAAARVRFAPDATLTYGQPLDRAGLRAAASAPGRFTFAVAGFAGARADIRPARADMLLPVGSYALIATFTPTGQGARIVVVRPLVVMPAILHVVPMSMRASAGGPVPDVSFTLRGLVAGDGPAAVPIAPVCRVAHPAGDDAPVRPAGRYLIFCDGGGAPNYTTDTSATATLDVVSGPVDPPGNAGCRATPWETLDVGPGCVSPSAAAARGRTVRYAFVCDLTGPGHVLAPAPD